MRNCKKFIEEHIKRSRGRSKWLRGEIKKLEKIEHLTVLENYDLCTKYWILVHAPFDNENVLAPYCKDCEHKPDANEVFQAMDDGD